MFERTIALALSAGTFGAFSLAAPPSGGWPEMPWSPRVIIKTVFVCAPKDEARIQPGMLVPKFVPTQRIVAADYPAVVQAQQQRKKKGKR